MCINFPLNSNFNNSDLNWKQLIVSFIFGTFSALVILSAYKYLGDPIELGKKFAQEYNISWALASPTGLIYLSEANSGSNIANTGGGENVGIPVPEPHHPLPRPQGGNDRKLIVGQGRPPLGSNTTIYPLPEIKWHPITTPYETTSQMSSDKYAAMFDWFPTHSFYTRGKGFNLNNIHVARCKHQEGQYIKDFKHLYIDEIFAKAKAADKNTANAQLLKNQFIEAYDKAKDLPCIECH